MAISTSPIHPPLTGIGEYTLRLTEALFDRDEVEELYGCERSGADRLMDPSALSSRLQRPPRSNPLARTAQRVRRLSDLLLARTPLDGMGEVVYHETNYLPFRYQGPTVVTVHDLSHVHFPAYHPRARVLAMNRLLPRALERADVIIAVSAYVAGELQAYYGLSAEKLRVIHHGVDPAFESTAPAAVQPVLRRYNLESDGYILSLATLEPRKNLDRLISAYERLPPGIRRQWPLVLAGAPGWRSSETRARIDRLVAAGTVRHLGYIPAADRAALYAGARAFAYPAIYEGFGLPPLEAMASGVPVLSSNRSAMPEVAGDAAHLVDPYDVEAMTTGLRNLLEDESLRAQLRGRGLARASGFTWQQCAAATVGAYQQAAT